MTSNVIDFPVKPRNDSNLPSDVAIEVVERDGIKIQFGDLVLLVMRPDFERARHLVETTSFLDRVVIARNVVARLTELQPQLLDGKHLERAEYDALYQDMMIWQVLKDMGVL